MSNFPALPAASQEETDSLTGFSSNYVVSVPRGTGLKILETPKVNKTRPDGAKFQLLEPFLRPHVGPPWTAVHTRAVSLSPRTPDATRPSTRAALSSARKGTPPACPALRWLFAEPFAPPFPSAL